MSSVVMNRSLTATCSTSGHWSATLPPARGKNLQHQAKFSSENDWKKEPLAKHTRSNRRPELKDHCTTATKRVTHMRGGSGDGRWGDGGLVNSRGRRDGTAASMYTRGDGRRRRPCGRGRGRAAGGLAV
jgi:hypothetical protein